MAPSCPCSVISSTTHVLFQYRLLDTLTLYVACVPIACTHSMYPDCSVHQHYSALLLPQKIYYYYVYCSLVTLIHTLTICVRTWDRDWTEKWIVPDLPLIQTTLLFVICRRIDQHLHPGSTFDPACSVPMIFCSQPMDEAAWLFTSSILMLDPLHDTEDNFFFVHDSSFRNM